MAIRADLSAKFQFLLHAQYLMDTKTGLWYHGWEFTGDGSCSGHNYAEALWARGNCWVSLANWTQSDVGRSLLQFPTFWSSSSWSRQTQCIVCLWEPSLARSMECSDGRIPPLDCGVRWSMMMAVMWRRVDRQVLWVVF